MGSLASLVILAHVFVPQSWALYAFETMSLEQEKIAACEHAKALLNNNSLFIDRVTIFTWPPTIVGEIMNAELRFIYPFQTVIKDGQTKTDNR
ncbi:hypothetical protein GCM10011607_00360 [Shewanella inventionis]|uniref:Uncharacterized protein n=1 Tax=Shewanella inventionis TaxID=1738770 RepID=A0ABQ1IKU3_9GAMM|nr:hypothetical protein GCM10011607_00360 [Shewanella inventionis]